MKDRYLVTLEIETYDGDPKSWNWDTLYIGEETVKIIESQWKGRVLPTNEGDPEIKCFVCGDPLDEDDIVWADEEGQIGKEGNDTAWCVSCLPSEGESNE